MNSKSTNLNSKTQFVRNATAHQLGFHDYEEPNILEFYFDKIQNEQELYINIREVLSEFSSLVKRISLNSGKLIIKVSDSSHLNLDIVEEVIFRIGELGYEIDELDHNIYRLSEGRG